MGGVITQKARMKELVEIQNTLKANDFRGKWQKSKEDELEHENQWWQRQPWISMEVERIWLPSTRYFFKELMASENIWYFYLSQKLATEYAKLRAQSAVLKKGLLEEQERSQSLQDQVCMFHRYWGWHWLQINQRETSLRKGEGEMEAVLFRCENIKS